jgi:hypothetical protein
VDFGAALCSDEGMTITGTITRLVQGKRRDRSDDQVFILPDDPAVLKKLDGSQFFASGEIAASAKIDDLEVGKPHTIEIAA